MNQQIKPILKRVYVKLVDNENKTASGIYLGQIKSDIETGIVIASASDLIKVGDKVIFNKYSVSKIDDTSVIINQDNILGIVE